MSDPKFLVVSQMYGTMTISLDNILSIKPAVYGSTITLKELKNGNNVEINTSDKYDNIIRAIEVMTSK